MNRGNRKALPLPEGWCWTTLGELAAAEPNSITDGPFGSKLKTSHYTRMGPRVIRLQNIGDGYFKDERAFISCEHFQSLSKHHIYAGDIAIAALGETLPRSCIIPAWVGPALVKADCPRFRPDPDLAVPAYVNFALNSPDVRARTSSTIHGVGRPRLNLSELRGIELPLAPFNEQIRIAEALDELLSDLDAGIAALERVRAKLGQYRAAVLKAAVSGELTADWREKHPATEPATKLLQRILTERRRRWEEVQLQKFQVASKAPPKDWKSKYKEPATPDTSTLSQLPEGWSWATVEQLSTKVVDGVHKKPNYVASGIPFVTVRNLTAGPGISFEKLNYVTPEDHAEFIKRADPQRGDILISKDGTLGVVRAVDCDTVFSIFVSVALVKPVLRETGSYLATALSAPQVQVQMVPKGSGLVHIHLEDLREDCVPIPPLQEQAAIVEAVEDQLSVIDHLEADLETRLRSSTGLRQSIFRHAFSGQLVPQNPGDEPASELLKRIAAEREERERQAQAEKNGKPKTKTSRKRTAKARK